MMTFNVYKFHKHSMHYCIPLLGIELACMHDHIEVQQCILLIQIFLYRGEECGPVYVVWLVYRPAVIAAHPDIIKVCHIPSVIEATVYHRHQ